MGRLEYSLEAVNRRLREGRSKARVKPRGGTLSLQATLPPKPGSERPRAYQQVISLGLPVNEEGLRAAEQEALLLSARLIRREFSWDLYLRESRLSENRSAGEWIRRFKAHYLETNSLKESTWKSQWDKVYRQLPADKPITVEQLLELAQRPRRDSRYRLQVCQKLQKLADFIGLKVDLLQYEGCYGPSKVQERSIPTDAEIAYWWGQIPNAKWRWIYGAIAAFGLRPHEAFFCVLDVNINSTICRCSAASATSSRVRSINCFARSGVSRSLIPISCKMPNSSDAQQLQWVTHPGRSVEIGGCWHSLESGLANRGQTDAS